MPEEEPDTGAAGRLFDAGRSRTDPRARSQNAPSSQPTRRHPLGAGASSPQPAYAHAVLSLEGRPGTPLRRCLEALAQPDDRRGGVSSVRPPTPPR